MNEEDNKYLAKKMGLCWHVWDGNKRCLYCNLVYPSLGSINPDFTTEHGFFLVFEWTQNQGWWQEFWDQLPEMMYYHTLPIRLIGPHFSEEVVAFLKRMDTHEQP